MRWIRARPVLEERQLVAGEAERAVGGAWASERVDESSFSEEEVVRMKLRQPAHHVADAVRLEDRHCVADQAPGNVGSTGQCHQVGDVAPISGLRGNDVSEDSLVLFGKPNRKAPTPRVRISPVEIVRVPLLDKIKG